MAEEMEVNKIYIAFLDGIIEKTKNGEIAWRYLDKNKALYEGMLWTTTRSEFGLLGSKEKVFPDFNVEDSFYAYMGEMNIVLYTWRNNPAVLYVVPNTFKKVVRMDPDEYGDRITRLLNLVQSQFPNAEDFISKFVEGN